MKNALSRLTCCGLLMGLMVACNAKGVPTTGVPVGFDQALTYDVSFTDYAVTTRPILQNAGGCEELSAGWRDSKGIQNLLFVGDPQFQRWAAPGKHVQDTVAMAMFWDRDFQFVFACKNAGQISYHATDWGSLDRSSIQKQGQNLVLKSSLVNGKITFGWNYQVKLSAPQNQSKKR